MPFALVIIGLILIVSGAKDTYRQLGAELQSDFTGPGNFTYWLAAIFLIGAVGYVEKLRPVSNLFLVLLILVIVIKNGGLFDRLNDFLSQGPVAPNAPPTDKVSATLTQDNSKQSNSSFGVGDAAKLALALA